jgi:hypothetical protein
MEKEGSECYFLKRHGCATHNQELKKQKPALHLTRQNGKEKENLG